MEYLRRTLYQVATVLINRADSTYDLGCFAIQQYTVKQKSFKLALIKVSQKLIHVIYAILVNNIEYSPSHEKEIHRKQVLTQRFQIKQSYFKIDPGSSLKKRTLIGLS